VITTRLRQYHQNILSELLEHHRRSRKKFKGRKKFSAAFEIVTEWERKKPHKHNIQHMRQIMIKENKEKDSGMA
jgi:hypothetical protein